MTRSAGLDVVVYGHAAADAAPDLTRLRRLHPATRLGPPSATAGSWLAVASVRGRVVGFARAERTPSPFPADHPRRAVARALGVDRSDAWLAGGLELVELVVDPAVRGRGIGGSLQQTVRTPAVRRRAWTALIGAETRAAAFFHRHGWSPVPGHGTGPVVLLAGEHPAVREGRLQCAPAPTGPALPWAHWAPAHAP